MTLRADELTANPDIIEQIEKVTLRMVMPAIYDFNPVLPNGLLQYRYNPTADDSIWRAGCDAPTRGEAFRVRISLAALKNKANWRVQTVIADLNQPLAWDD